nr:hypothetical protein CFP56_31273 [Quercus suber]
MRSSANQVTCNPGTVTESGSIQYPISKAQCEQLLAFLNASCNSGENHHAANVSTGNGLANLGSGVVDVCSSAGVPATAEYIVDDQAARALLLRGGVKLDEINLNAGDARTDASAVEDNSRIDASTVKGKTMIPRVEHEVPFLVPLQMSVSLVLQELNGKLRIARALWGKNSSTTRSVVQLDPSSSNRAQTQVFLGKFFIGEITLLEWNSGRHLSLLM